MANNELSGPLVQTALIEYFKKKKNNLSIRFLFIPEIIGSIIYINKNLKSLKKNTIGGFNLTCLGDKGKFSILEPKEINSLSYLSLKKVLESNKKKYNVYSFHEKASDEGNFNAVGVNLNIVSFMRSKYGKFKEYHTSLDNLSFINKKSLKESFKFLRKTINFISDNYKDIYPVTKIICEPQLGKRKLHPELGDKNEFAKKKSRDILNLLQYADGKKSLLEISLIIQRDLKYVTELFYILKKEEILE